MKSIKPTTYQTVGELEAIVRLRQDEAELLPSGPDKQRVLLEIAQLRAYADVKRWLGQPIRERSVVS